MDRNLPELFLGAWNPLDQQSGSDVTGGRGDESKDIPGGPEMCWDLNGSNEPLGIVEMTDEEKKVRFKSWYETLAGD